MLTKEIHMVDQVYEFDGKLYDTVGEFLQALAHAYKAGQEDLVLSALDDFGFDLNDIGVRPHEA